MRIGIMLRTLDEKGGIGVYTRNLVEELLALDDGSHYVFFYRNGANLGRYAHHPNVTERLLHMPTRALWDQVAVPIACRQEQLDLIFHPKFTVPLLAPCPAVMVLHGADWLIPAYARFYNRLDVAYIRAMMPLYCRKAAGIISVSRLTTACFNRTLNLPAGKIRTIYFGPARHFKRIEDRAVLARVREKYRLPERFILTFSKYAGGDRKNIDGILEAYRRLHGTVPHHLVVAGKDCAAFRRDYDLPDWGYGKDIFFTDWIEQADLPALYTLADLLLYPSRLEAFPIPLTEAMACGTPIVTSNVNGLAEIAGDAALLVDPEDHDAIAQAASRVLTDDHLRARLQARSLARAQRFDWRQCAHETLQLLQDLVRTGRAFDKSRYPI